MLPHIWRMNVVDGGHLGVGRFWRCAVCGASGPPYNLGRIPATGHAFLAGPAIRLSDDCRVARLEIRAYIDLRLKALTTRGVHHRYVGMLRDALRLTPEKSDITAVIGIMDGLEDRPMMRRLSLLEVRANLQQAGFLTQARPN